MPIKEILARINTLHAGFTWHIGMPGRPRDYYFVHSDEFGTAEIGWDNMSEGQRVGPLKVLQLVEWLRSCNSKYLGVSNEPGKIIVKLKFKPIVYPAHVILVPG